ncbi:MAG: preprotein translocase subunit SecG [Pseudomonadota bacterium]
MASVLLVVHLIICICLIGAVLLQRSEGGALGMGGGGGGGGGFMSGRGAANALTRATALLTVAFFATSIMLTLIARQDTSPSSVLDQAGQQSQGSEGQPPSSVLPQLPPSPGASPTPSLPDSN